MLSFGFVRQAEAVDTSPESARSTLGAACAPWLVLLVSKSASESPIVRRGCDMGIRGDITLSGEVLVFRMSGALSFLLELGHRISR